MCVGLLRRWRATSRQDRLRHLSHCLTTVFVTFSLPHMCRFVHRVGGEHKHDAVWRQEALRIGCNGEVCSDFLEPAPANWIVTCPCGEVQVKRYRVRPALLHKRCRKCKGQLHAERIAVPARTCTRGAFWPLGAFWCVEGMLGYQQQPT
jgi:hypothetical protein